MAARDDTPSIREIAELTARLRALSAAGTDADPVERAAFLADKDALLARIEDTHQAVTPLTAPCQRAPGSDARTAEATDWARGDQRPDTADDDTDVDGDGWSR